MVYQLIFSSFVSTQPPLKSPLYSKSNFNNGISAVEHCLLTITEKYGNVPFLLCGDFNARTGNKQPYHVLDMEYFTTVAQDEQYGAQGQRRSQDSEENDFGKLFLELCIATLGTRRVRKKVPEW